MRHRPDPELPTLTHFPGLPFLAGTYAIRPEVPFVPGSEGVAEVLEVGSGVDNLRAGDLVLPSEPCLGKDDPQPVLWSTIRFLPVSATE